MTAIEVSTAGLTVSVVEPAIPVPGSVAETVVVPVVTLVERPRLPAAFEIVATAVLEESHVTASVRSCVELSLYVPVAVNCWVVPSAIEGSVGVTAIDVRTAEETANVVESLTPVPGSVAWTVVVPIATLVARPWLPAAFDTSATPVFDELQVIESVRSCVVRSLKVPIAVNCWVVPSGIEAFVGVTASEVRTADETVSSVDPPMPLARSRARTVVVPTETLVPSPLLPATFETVATEGSDELQSAEAVRSCVVPSV